MFKPYKLLGAACCGALIAQGLVDAEHANATARWEASSASQVRVSDREQLEDRVSSFLGKLIRKLREVRRRTRPRRRQCDRARDRAAILQHAGTYEITFAADEVEQFDVPSDYLPSPRYRSGAREVVSVLQNEPGRVSLQHVLAINIIPPPAAPRYITVKHWRQDWVFEDTEIVEYQGERVWKNQRLSRSEARCTWSQSVHQVDDGPRYESYGRWVHSGGESSWTGKQSFRPLPRREFSIRDDYDDLLATNTHVVGAPEGWVHLQENLKWAFGSGSALAREEVENTYSAVDDPEAVEAVEAYLDRTGAFWSDTRAIWNILLSQSRYVHVATEVDGVSSFDVMLPLAEELADANPEERWGEIYETLAPYVTPARSGPGGAGY